jgi:hypothetical protein
MAASGESCRRRGHVLTARFDPERKLPVRRSIRDNVGNSRPATTRDLATFRRKNREPVPLD